MIALVLTVGIGYADITRTAAETTKELAEHSEALSEDDEREQQDAILHTEIKINQEYMRKEIDASNEKLDAILREIRQ